MTRAPKFLLIFAVIASAAPLDLSAWKYRKRIPLTPGDGLAVVKLDREVYMSASESLTDLRIVSEGQEVPWALSPLTYSAAQDFFVRKIVDKGLVGGNAVRFTVIARGSHDRVEILTAKHNFRQTVEIEASQDNEHWAKLRADGAIFDFSQDGHNFHVTDVPYPLSTRRYLRVTVLGWTDPSAIEGAIQIPPSERTQDDLEVISTITPSVIEESTTKSSVVTLDQGAPGLPITQLQLTVLTPVFHRGIFVEVSNDGKQWSGSSGLGASWENSSSSFIRRVQDSDFFEESLIVAVGVTGGRYHRVHVYNGDDKPLKFGPIQCVGRLRLLKFRAADRGDYWLYYGSSTAVVPPAYDLEKTLSYKEALVRSTLRPGPAELNPTYRPPSPPKKPWSEQHPAILYTVLGGAVLALGIAIFRFAARLR